MLELVWEDGSLSSDDDDDDSVFQPSDSDLPHYESDGDSDPVTNNRIRTRSKNIVTSRYTKR